MNRPPTRAGAAGGGPPPPTGGAPPPTGALRGPGMYQHGQQIAPAMNPHFAGQPQRIGTGAGVRPGSGMVGAPPGTGMRRLGTGAMPPGTGMVQGGAIGMVTNVEISARPVTQQGMSGMKTAAQGPGRQVADKSFFLNTLRVKIQEISSETDKLTEEIEKKQREGNEFAHLQRRFEAAQKKTAERQITLQDYIFAQKKQNMDMDDIQAKARELGEKSDWKRKQVDEVFKERKQKEGEMRDMEKQMSDLRSKANARLQDKGKDMVDRYQKLSDENQQSQQSIEQQRRQLTDLSMRVNQLEDELKQDPLRKKGAQLTADKKMYDEQLRDLKMEEDDESLPFDEAKKRLLKKIKDDNEAIQRMDQDKSSISQQIKEMKEKIQNVNNNLQASQGGKNEKYAELQQKDREMSTYLESYAERKKANVNAVLQSERNAVTLLKHMSQEINRQTSLPSQQDAASMQSDLAFKNQQYENAETTLQRVQVELAERKQDLDRVEELERKMNQEMENLGEKMKEMRQEIMVFENIDGLKSKAEMEKAALMQRRNMLKKRRHALKAQLKVQQETGEKRTKDAKDNERENELNTHEKKIKGMEETLFILREFVAAKKAETNVAPLRDEVRGLGMEINTMLVDMQQKAA